MQTLLLPAAHSVTGSAPSALSSAGKPCRHNFFGRQITLISSPSSLSLPPLKTKPLSFPQFSLINKRTRILASAPLSPPYTSPNDESEKAKLAQVLSYFCCYSISFSVAFCNVGSKLLNISPLNLHFGLLSY